MKPMLKYRGGKSKEIDILTAYMPAYNGRYIEPFFGGGALFFHLEPKNAIINDINTPLMDFYKAVRDDYDKLKADLSKLQEIYEANVSDYKARKEKEPDVKVNDKNEELYYEIRKFFNGEEANIKLHPAAVYYFINKTAYSGMIRYNKQGKYNVPYGRYKNFNTDLITKDHHYLLRQTEIYNESYDKIFDLAKKDDFIFLDPPYDSSFSDYGNKETIDGFTEAMHIKLATDFRNLPCKSLMVIGKTPLIEELYGDLIVHEYEKTYAVNIRNRFKADASHALIANY